MGQAGGPQAALTGPGLGAGGAGAGLALTTAAHQSPAQPLLPQLTPQQQRGLEESFVMLGAASVLRPGPAGHAHLSPLHMQLLQQQQQQQQMLMQQQQQMLMQQQQQQQQQKNRQSPSQQQLPHGSGQPGPSFPLGTATQAQAQTGLPQGPAASPQQQPQPQPSPHASPTQSLPQSGSGRAGGGGGGSAAAAGPTAGGPGGSAAAGDVGGAGGAGPDDGGAGGSAGSGLDSKLQALAQLFELASTNTQVDHPLCMDCVGQLKEEMEAQIAEAEREMAAYAACLAQLEGGGAGAAAAAAAGGAVAGSGDSSSGGGGGSGAAEGPSSADAAAAAGAAVGAGAGPGPGSGAEEEYYVLEEISRLEQERDQERARAEVLESELSAVAAELTSLAAASADLDSLEERYWHDVADFELLLRSHTDERGALLAKIDRAGQRLQLLKNTSVLYDAFKIWHDGPFGTISGFRLGRTPEVPVEWDEVNAAWGQAVLLLHTMAQMVKLQFSQYRLLPMGSHPRVADKRSTYDLFGPVSKLWSANYDRAMTAYLACLREFGEFARRKDVQDGKATPFNFPFAIDGDKVNGATIKLTLNKDLRWTKALKFMLANLKIALQWTVKQDQAADAPPLPHLAQEGPQLVPER